MSRKLEPGLKAVLGRATRRTTLSITLGDGTPLHYSTALVEIYGTTYLPKLAPAAEAVNLEPSMVENGVNLKISNQTLVLGQLLMNTPNVLNNMRAMLGCYFYDKKTGGEWHDEKLPGVITVGKIDREWIEIYFEGLATALKYPGITVESAFPNHEIAAPAPAQPPVYNDLVNVPTAPDVYGGGGFSNFTNFDGRNYMPELSFQDYRSY